MADASHITLHFRVFRGGELLLEAEHSEPSISIGRAEHALLRIDDPSVGDLHAVINVEEDGTVQLLDLGTAAGTTFGGSRISNANLSTGDRFTLGNVEVQVRYDEKENTTPTMDVRPDAPAAGMADTDDTAGPPLLEETYEDVVELVMRSGSGNNDAGIDSKAPKVLEVNQIWQNLLLDTKHYGRGAKVRVGASIGYRWSLLGVPLGWVPPAYVGVLRASPPMWSEVLSDWRSDFYASDEALPGGVDHELFVADGNSFVARVDSHWDGFADIGAQRLSETEPCAQAKAEEEE